MPTRSKPASSNPPIAAPPRRPSRSRRKQKRLIRESVLTLEPAFDLVGQLFFLKLFRLDPAFRARFAGTPADARPEIHGGAEARHRLAQP